MDINTIQALRQDIIGEIEAIIQYEEHISKTNNEIAKKVWTSIKNEEMVHLGELFAVLDKLDANTSKQFVKGQKEAEELINDSCNN